MRVAILLFNPIPESLVPIAEACLRFSPQLCLTRKSTIFIEIGKCSQLYREETFLARVAILLKKFDLSAQVVIADSILSALILGKYGTLELKDLPLTSFYEYLDPFLIQPEHQKWIAKMIESLKHVGIQTVAEFMNVPTTELASRFGKESLLLKLRITGEQDLGWPLWVPAEPIIESLDLEATGSCGDLEPLLFHFRPLLDRAFSRLWGRGLRAASLKLSFDLEKSSVVPLARREWIFDFVLPQTSSRGTLPILRERLDRDLARKPLLSRVLKVSLEILQTAKDYQGQKHFFHAREEVQEALHSAIALLTEGLGKNQVFQVILHENALPEKSWSRSFLPQKTRPDLSYYIPSRPTRILKKPLPVSVTPQNIIIRGHPYPILKWSAVEHLSLDWLHDEINRSYYYLDLEKKPSVWIFKDATDQYFLHGYFT